MWRPPTSPEGVARHGAQAPCPSRGVAGGARRGRAGRDPEPGLESPRGAAVVDRPGGRRHRRVRVQGRRRLERADHRRQLDPVRGSRRRPNFYRFDDRATYYVNVDNTGDGRYDIRYRFRFRTKVGDRDSFLYALPGVSSIRDRKLNIQQTYSVVRETYRNGRETGRRVLGANLPVAPNNVGPKTIPNYSAVWGAASRRLNGGGRMFAGQADDPFYVDLGSTFDAINIRNGTGNAGGGKDDLAGYNTHAVVLQVPIPHVTSNRQGVSGPAAPSAVVGLWASTNRERLAVSADAGFGPTTRQLRREGRQDDGEVQVSRLGNPLVNEVVIPLGKKDLFNATQPSDDLKNFGRYVLSPQLAKVINALSPA
jgi:hypothetical protein